MRKCTTDRFKWLHTNCTVLLEHVWTNAERSRLLDDISSRWSYGQLYISVFMLSSTLTWSGPSSSVTVNDYVPKIGLIIVVLQKLTCNFRSPQSKFSCVLSSIGSRQFVICTWGFLPKKTSIFIVSDIDVNFIILQQMLMLSK